MTTTNAAKQTVQSGYYLNTQTWQVVPVAKDGEQLPVGAWRRVPTAALLAVPFVGLAFVVFLPLIGLAMTLRAAFRPAVELASDSAGNLAATMGQPWQPGEAHLTGKSDEHAEAEPQGPPAKDASVEALQSEIEQKRKGH